MRRYFVEALQTMREINSFDDALLQSACRHEARAMLAAKWLRDEGKNLAINERLSLTATISNATDSRDKCLKLLGLDRLADAGDAWGSIPVFESAATNPSPTGESTPQNNKNGGLADSSHLASTETSADASECDSPSDPTEVAQKIKQVANSQDAGGSVSGNCDSGQNEYTREDRSH
jgi:hypothetical protein